LDAKKELRNMTSANIQHKNTFLNWRISIAIGLTLFAGLNATAGTGYQIETIAGDGTASFSGEGSAATAARLNNPFGIFVHSSGDTYFADTANHRIRKITASNGIISTIAGTGTAGFADGAATTTAMLSSPNGVYVDGSGNVYIADTGNQRIRKITGSTISTIAGTGTAGFADGNATTARFSSPYGVFVDSSNNVYIADAGNHRVRKLSEQQFPPLQEQEPQVLLMVPPQQQLCLAVPGEFGQIPLAPTYTLLIIVTTLFEN